MLLLLFLLLLLLEEESPRADFLFSSVRTPDMLGLSLSRVDVGRRWRTESEAVGLVLSAFDTRYPV